MNIVWTIFTSGIDILITTLIIYFVIKILIRTEKLLFILNALIFFIIFYFIANILNLNSVLFILNSISAWIVLIVFILFQKEIRDTLEKLGSLRSIINESDNKNKDLINELYESAYALSRNKIGALITIERSVSLNEYTAKAVYLNANFSKQLLEVIFNKDSALHDGAVVIKNEKIMYASTFYPISLDLNIDQSFGTRHRSALTISKETDALTIVVSEENANISITCQGKLFQNVSEEFFKEFIKEKIN